MGSVLKPEKLEMQKKCFFLYFWLAENPLIPYLFCVGVGERETTGIPEKSFYKLVYFNSN